MSGGTFDYKQYELNEMIDVLEVIILRNHSPDDNGFCYNFSDETIIEFKKGLKLLRESAIYMQRIDWLCAGDDGEDSFHSRLKEQLLGMSD